MVCRSSYKKCLPRTESAYLSFRCSKTGSIAVFQLPAVTRILQRFSVHCSSYPFGQSLK